ncbi:hypothetical protein [Tabrizicola sp.]|uniref:hypothetical protein n=1 Tax=Tabrizicola sp. TaxID=2005166 RepID=UPI003F38E929
MPLFLQALPLSLKTVWRYLAVLPILGIIALLLLLASIIPGIGYFVPGTVYAYCIMTGLRCALVARGHTVDPEFGQMLRGGLVFCLMTIGATFVIEYLSVYLSAGILMVVRAFGLGGEAWSGVWIWLGGGLSLYVFLMLIWGAALAVPMTAVVADADAKGTGVNPFKGLGTGIVGLSIISLIWMIGGNLFSFFGEVATMFALVSSTIYAVFNAKDPAWDVSLSPFSLLGGTLFMTWASSWFFSAAVLYWERAEARRKATASAQVKASRATSDDLRALRESRMQKERGPD